MPSVGAHGAPEKQQFARAALADDARQHRARAHVAAGEADAVEQERGLRFRRRIANVGRHGDDRAGADADAVDGGDDRLRAMAHGFDQIAGHAREVEQFRHAHFGERGDDVVHVAAGAEIAAGAGEHHRLDARSHKQARGTHRAARRRTRTSADSCARADRARCARRRQRTPSGSVVARKCLGSCRFTSSAAPPAGAVASWSPNQGAVKRGAGSGGEPGGEPIAAEREQGRAGDRGGMRADRRGCPCAPPGPPAGQRRSPGFAPPRHPD